MLNLGCACSRPSDVLSEMKNPHSPSRRISQVQLILSPLLPSLIYPLLLNPLHHQLSQSWDSIKMTSLRLTPFVSWQYACHSLLSTPGPHHVLTATLAIALLLMLNCSPFPSLLLHPLEAHSSRTIQVDATFKANSGHPGAPMGLAPAAHVMFNKFMSFNPSNPDWLNRDRFVLS